MKVLITGGTGFIGQYVIERLILDQHEVVCTTRDIAKAKKNMGYPVEFIQWNPSSEIIQSPVLKDIDAVIHLLGESVGEGRWSEAQKKRILDSRVKSTENLIESFKQQNHNPRVWVNASAVGIYPDTEGDEILDEASMTTDNFLADVCKKWEAAASLVSDQTRLSIIRIGIVLGTEGGILSKLLPIFKKGAGGKVASGKQWMSWIHVKDVAKIIYESLHNEKMSGVFNATSPGAVTNLEFTKSLAKYLGRPAAFPVPSFALGVVMGEAKSLALSSQRIKSSRLSEVGFEFDYPTLDEALIDILAYGALPPETKASSHETHRQVQWVDRPLEEVFEFYADATNLEKITPAFLKFKILSQSTPRIQEGTEFTYKLKVHGMPIKWTTIITEWEDQKKFVDYQQRGPYQVWYHQHFFYPYKGGTLLVDYVRYKLPMGYLGQTFGMPLVKKDVRDIFTYRRDIIDQYWGQK
jgi:uncharacterized protein (TIGR01777 family)